MVNEKNENGAKSVAPVQKKAPKEKVMTPAQVSSPAQIDITKPLTQYEQGLLVAQKKKDSSTASSEPEFFESYYPGKYQAHAFGEGSNPQQGHKSNAPAQMFVKEEEDQKSLPKQGKGLAINDSPELEHEADLMGKNAAEGKSADVLAKGSGVQRKEDADLENNQGESIENTQNLNANAEYESNNAPEEFIKDNVPVDERDHEEKKEKKDKKLKLPFKKKNEFKASYSLGQGKLYIGASFSSAGGITASHKKGNKDKEVEKLKLTCFNLTHTNIKNNVTGSLAKGEGTLIDIGEELKLKGGIETFKNDDNGKVNMLTISLKASKTITPEDAINSQYYNYGKELFDTGHSMTIHVTYSYNVEPKQAKINKQVKDLEKKIKAIEAKQRRLAKKQNKLSKKIEKAQDKFIKKELKDKPESKKIIAKLKRKWRKDNHKLIEKLLKNKQAIQKLKKQTNSTIGKLASLSNKLKSNALKIVQKSLLKRAGAILKKLDAVANKIESGIFGVKLIALILNDVPISFNPFSKNKVDNMGFTDSGALAMEGAHNKLTGKKRLIFKGSGGQLDELPEAIDKDLANEIKDYVEEHPELFEKESDGEGNKWNIPVESEAQGGEMTTPQRPAYLDEPESIVATTTSKADNTLDSSNSSTNSLEEDKNNSPVEASGSTSGVVVLEEIEETGTGGRTSEQSDSENKSDKTNNTNNEDSHNNYDKRNLEATSKSIDHFYPEDVLIGKSINGEKLKGVYGYANFAGKNSGKCELDLTITYFLKNGKQRIAYIKKVEGIIIFTEQTESIDGKITGGKIKFQTYKPITVVRGQTSICIGAGIKTLSLYDTQ